VNLGPGGVDHVDTEPGHPLDLLQVSIEVGKRVFKEANGFRG
jgi:hypothetical protein